MKCYCVECRKARLEAFGFAKASVEEEVEELRTYLDSDTKIQRPPSPYLEKALKKMYFPDPIQSEHFQEWDEYYMAMAYMTAMRSKDNSTWIGAVIVGPDGEIRSTGYNGFPRGVKYTEERLQRPVKYDFTEHGERNAIYNAARAGVSTNGCTLYTHGLPCFDCARAVIQSGIKQVVGTKHGLVESYSESEAGRKAMLDEAGIVFREMDYNPSGKKIVSKVSGEYHGND